MQTDANRVLGFHAQILAMSQLQIQNSLII